MAKSRRVTKKKDGPCNKPLVASKQQTIQFDRGLPDTLDEAIVLFYALAFGPIRNSVTAEALALTGMTMPNGGKITLQKIVPHILNLEKENLLVPSERESIEFDLDDVELEEEVLELDDDVELELGPDDPTVRGAPPSAPEEEPEEDELIFASRLPDPFD